MQVCVSVGNELVNIKLESGEVVLLSLEPVKICCTGPRN